MEQENVARFEERLSSDEALQAELGAVAGGTGFCYFIGGSNDIENEDVHVCAYVGVTLG